jgi:hypothetical protein
LKGFTGKIAPEAVAVGVDQQKKIQIAIIMSTTQQQQSPPAEQLNMFKHMKSADEGNSKAPEMLSARDLMEKLKLMEKDLSAANDRNQLLETSLAAANNTIELLLQKDHDEPDLNAEIEAISLPSKDPLEIWDLPSKRGGPREVLLNLLHTAECVSEVDGTYEFETWLKDVESGLTRFPMIAKARISHFGRLGSSLLEIACTLLVEFIAVGPDESIPDAEMKIVRQLIRANPHALLWHMGDNMRCRTNLQWFNMGWWDRNHDIFLFVVEEFGYIFHQEECLRSRPHLQLLDAFKKHEADLSTVDTFFRSLPTFVRQMRCLRSKQYPVHEILQSIVNHDISVFEWGGLSSLIEFMITIFPESLVMKDSSGRTPLHFACALLMKAEVERENFRVIQETIEMNVATCVDVCGMLIERCPGAVRQEDRHGHTPFDLLKDAPVKVRVAEIVLSMMRIFFPLSLSETSKENTFIQKAYSLVEEEASVALNYVRLTLTSAVIEKNTKLSHPSRSINECAEIHQIYSSWAEEHGSALSIKLETLKKEAASKLHWEFPVLLLL